MNHEYSKVYEYQEIFYENLSFLLEFKGKKILHVIYSQIIKYLIQPNILKQL